MSQARDLLEAKLALEFEIGTALVRAGLVYIRSWISNEGRISVMERQGHQSAIERALLRHYARVAYVMGGVTPPKDADLRGAVLTLRHMDSLRARAHRSAMMILAGIDRDLQASLDLVKSDADDIETKAPKKPIGMSVIAEGTFAKAGQRAAKKLKKRGKALGNVETEEPAEQSRFELVPQGDTKNKVVKVWNSLLDGRERPAHHEAHGQEQKVDALFVVGGENLMYPGDTSHGASLGNIIGCRCFLTYTLVTDDGQRVPVGLSTPSRPARRTWREGDELGFETPVTPTILVTLNGRTRGRIVLADETFATLRQETPDTIVIRQNGRDIARATVSGNGDVSSMVVDPDYAAYGLDKLIRDSVRHSAGPRWPRAPLSIAPPKP